MINTFKNFIPARVAANSLLLIFSLVTVFHLLIIVRIIPFDIVWGGGLKDADQMIVFESISLLLNVIMISVVGSYVGLLKIRMNQRNITVAFWLMTILFFINTVGNGLSGNQTENFFFTPLTLVICVFCFRLAIDRKNAVPTVESK